MELCRKCRGWFDNGDIRDHRLRCRPTGRGEPTEPYLRRTCERASRPESAISDPFTLKLVERFRKGHNTKKKSDDTARTRFIDCDKLLEALRRREPGNFRSLEECVVPENYPSVLAGVGELSGFDPATRDVRTPGTVDRLLATLRDATALRREEASTARDLDQETRRRVLDECERFDRLLTGSWPNDIGNHAKATALRRRCENPPPLPEGEDVRAVYAHALQLVAQYSDLLARFPTVRNFVQLNRALLAALTIYNGRRACEVAEAPHDCFRSRPTGVAQEQELRVVPILDRAVGVRTDPRRRPQFFLVPGDKNTRPVAVIVPPDLLPAIELVARTRHGLGIPDPENGPGLERLSPSKKNPERADAPVYNNLLFPRPDSLDPYRVTEIIRRLRNTTPGLRRSADLSTRAIRTRLATIAAELGDHLAVEALHNHLDHSEDTHRRYYRSADPGAATRGLLADDPSAPRDPTPGTSGEQQSPSGPAGTPGAATVPPPVFTLEQVQAAIPWRSNFLLLVDLQSQPETVRQIAEMAAATPTRYALEELPGDAFRVRCLSDEQSAPPSSNPVPPARAPASDAPPAAPAPPTSTAVPPARAPVSEAPPGTSKGAPAQRSPPVVPKEEPVEIDLAPGEEPSAELAVPSADTAGTSAARTARHWTPEEEGTLRTVFADFISAGNMPTRAEILARVLSGLTPEGRSVDAIRGHLYKMESDGTLKL